MNNEILYVKLAEILSHLDRAISTVDRTTITTTALKNSAELLHELVTINEPVVSSPVTPEEAAEIMKTLNNGVVSGISGGKNGRAWLVGEFELCHLESICTLVRAEAGDNAQGARELYDYWKREGMLEEDIDR